MFALRVLSTCAQALFSLFLIEIIGTNTSPNFGGPLVNQEMRAQVETLQK
mgnify:CR=1 FL=1